MHVFVYVHTNNFVNILQNVSLGKQSGNIKYRYTIDNMLNLSIKIGKNFFNLISRL